MYLLLIVLNNESHVKDILEKFVDIDIRGATIINSQGMGRILSDKIPIFPSLKYVLSGNEKRVNNFTIFSAIESEKTLQDAVDVVMNIVKDIDKPGVGIMMVLPVLKIYGLAENNIKEVSG
jgi:nitrogen regulatory protein P-II 1